MIPVCFDTTQLFIEAQKAYLRAIDAMSKKIWTTSNSTTEQIDALIISDNATHPYEFTTNRAMTRLL